MSLQLPILFKLAGLPEPDREVVFAPPRRYRADFFWSWPDGSPGGVIVEYEGILCRKSRHTSVTGYSNDCQKYNLASIMGFVVIRFTMLHSESYVIETLKKAAILLRGHSSAT